MRLFSELSKALAAEGMNTTRVQYTIVDGKGGYFQNVKRILELSDTSIVLSGRKGTVRVEGSGLSLGKCFGGDVTVFGDIARVAREDA